MDKKKSHVGRTKSKSAGHHGSDSEGSPDSNSLSGESNNDTFVKVPLKDTASGKNAARRGSEWEILEGLKDGQRFEKKPDVFEGYLLKKRKWPLKGWHKRFFVVDKGILIYAKGPGEIARGKLHGSLDIGLSVISSKLKRKRIDIDAEEFIYHLKAKSLESFRQWVEQLKKHRLYRQHILTFGNRELPLLRPTEDVSPSVPSPSGKGGSPAAGSTDVAPSSTPSSALQGGPSRIANWIMDSNGLDSVSRELALVQQNLVQLNIILEQIEMLPTGSEHGDIGDGCSPNVKKDRKKFGLRKKKSSKGSAADLVGCSPNKNPQCEPDSTSPGTGPQAGLAQMSQLSSSNPSLPSAVLTAARPQSLPGPEHLLLLGSSLGESSRLSTTPDHHCREDFAILAKDILVNLREAAHSLMTERDRLKQAVEIDSSVHHTGASTALVASLRTALTSALQQNNDLKNRLNRIHENSDLSDVSSIAQSDQTKPLQHSLSYSSSCLSASEFYDAQESPGDQAADNISDTSSEASLSSEEGSVTSENSELGTDCTPAHSIVDSGRGDAIKCLTGRRTKLPAPRPDLEGLSLWNLLCKNIGKDLSKISMPVALNEPLSMLQRLCEELEYSELLDKAAELDDPYERMVCIAAFAVSSYGSSYYRAASKPFNPILGETYECIREDKGFRFIAEQVSHHPPVSVCHAESRNFVFWQDARIKTKFWGKSMEFQPAGGTVNVRLPRTGDQYSWSKVTTCVHNVFGGQRWVDQYGELCITSSSNIKCKLTFVRASYWSAKRHEVFGTITNSDGKVVRSLFGKWNEALYCGVAPSARCIWRPGTMPEDYELYYGFTRFAMELNEIDPDMSKYLPRTDTRFRPDQRLLEEGNLGAAEAMKQQLEQQQRERRKFNESDHMPRWFLKNIGPRGEETWEFADTYWSRRKNPGFLNLNIPAIW